MVVLILDRASAMQSPSNPAELAAALRDAASNRQTIALSGNSTKRRMAGPIEPAAVEISTLALRRVIEYEPRDLTISVDAGLPWRELKLLLAAQRQMVPLDPPFSDGATVGGVIAANTSGPRRRLYGTARDLVIGMQFATLEGKLVQSGGMVVKNVAGLDMAKLMIGSFGTLAAIAVVNFKLLPMPEVERSFLLCFDGAAAAVAARNRILQGQLQPAAIDLLNPAAGASLGNPAWLLVLRAAGNAAAVQRYEREFAELGEGMAYDDDRQEARWGYVENFTPGFLANRPEGAVVRASCTLKELESVMASFDGPAVARAGSGVCYGYFEQADAAAEWLSQAAGRGWKAVMEYAPDRQRQTLDLWPAPGKDFDIMQRIKNLFDPSNLLNRGRLYGRI
jgi:glycolate oxidase FAD binding subunit